MGEVLGVVAPIYLTVAIGYLAVRTGLFPASGLTVVGGYVVNIALPALLFGVLARNSLGDVVQPTYVLSYALGSLVAMAVGYGLTLLIQRHAPPVRARLRAAYVGQGSAVSNSGYVGYPVVQAVMPAQAGHVLGMNVLVENLLSIPLGLVLAEHAAGDGQGRLALSRQIAARLVRQPLVIAIVLGVAYSASGLPLPEPLDRTLSMVAGSATAPALFVIGGLLVGQSLGGRALQVAPLLVGKLVAHPLAVAVLVYGAAGLVPRLGLPPLEPVLAAAAVISASAPTMSILPLLAARHHEEEFVSAAAFATTLLSLVSLSVALLVVGPAHA